MAEHHPGEPQAEDFRNALQDLDTYIDVSVEDLMQIQRLASVHARRRSAEQMRLRDLMTSDVVTVTPETPLREAARLLLERRISGLPVVDANHKLVGIVTEADFLCALGIPCHHPAHNLWQTLEGMFRHTARNEVIPETVAGILQANVITLHPEDSLHDAIGQMKKHHIKRLVITDAEGRVCGIVTRSNLVSVLLRRML